MEKQGIEKDEIYKRLILDEHDFLNQAKVETRLPKEKSIFRKGMELWMRRKTATRLLISTGLVTGVVAVASGFSAPAIAIFAGYRYLRGVGAILVGKLAGEGVDWAMSRGIQAEKEAALAQLRKGFEIKTLKETEKELQKILEQIAKKERRKFLIKGATMAAVGASSAIGVSWLEQSGVFRVRVVPPVVAPPEVAPSVETPPKALTEVAVIPKEVKAPILEIGKRGPEGAIIDYFEANPKAAKSFGWDGKVDLTEWSGKKAHLLWLEDAKEVLAKPETLEQLKKLGYSTDAEGYAQMMHRIGKGSVEINPETGKINLVDMEYLKARVPQK